MTDNVEQLYSGPERRANCVNNCPFADQAKKSVPRVYFFASWSALIVCLIAFAGWHESSMDKLELDMQQREIVHKRQVDDRIVQSSNAYTQDVERFIRATKEIRDLLREVQTDIGEIKVLNAEFKTKQDMVIEKIKLTE